MSDGSVQNPDQDLAKKLVSKNVLSDKTLNQNSQVGGIIAVETEGDIYPVMLSYNDGLNKVQHKNLPRL
jgi:hypothetical protein